MSLDLTALSSQVRDMSKNVAQQASVIEAHIQQLRQMYLAQAGHEAYWAEVVEQKQAAAPWRVLARPTQERFDFVREGTISSALLCSGCNRWFADRGRPARVCHVFSHQYRAGVFALWGGASRNALLAAEALLP